MRLCASTSFARWKLNYMSAARLFTTIVRFDVAYHGNFKCNLGTIRHDYPEIDRWLRNLYWNYPAFRDATR